MRQANLPKAAMGRFAAGVGIAFLALLLSAPAATLAVFGDTTLTATKTSTAQLVETIAWTLSKSASPSELTLQNGEAANVTYTVGASRQSELSARFSGEICVTNIGPSPTVGLAIVDVVTKPPSKTVLGSVEVDVSARPILDPGDVFCYPYSVSVPASFTPGERYRNTASVVIENHTGPTNGPTAAKWATVPESPDITYNDQILVLDTNGFSWFFSSTDTRNYDWTFTCDFDAGSNSNTIFGFFVWPPPDTATATVDVTCLEPTSSPSPSPTPSPSPSAAPSATPPISEPISPPISEPISPPVCPPISEPISPPISEPISEPISPPISEPIGDPSLVASASPSPEATSSPGPPPIQSREAVDLASSHEKSSPLVELLVYFGEPISPPISEPISEPISPPISEPASPPEPPPCPTATFLGASTILLLGTVLSATLLLAGSVGAIAAGRLESDGLRPEGAPSAI